MNPKNKTILAAAIFSVLTISLSLFVFYPLFKGIKEASLELIGQKEKLSAWENDVKNLKKNESLLKETKANFEKMDTLFVDEKLPVDFIRFLEGTSREYQLYIKIYAPAPEKTGKDFWPSLVFQVYNSGPFSNFMKFIEKLESSQYLTQIQNLNITRIETTEVPPPGQESEKTEKITAGNVRTNILFKVYAK